VVLRGDGAAPAQQREGGQGVPRRGRHVQRVAASRVAAREADAALEQHEQHAWVIHEGVPGLHLGDMGLQPGDTQGCMPGHVGLQPLVDRVTAASSVPVRPDAAASSSACTASGPACLAPKRARTAAVCPPRTAARIALPPSPLPSLPPGPPSSAETSGRTETSGRSEGGGASDEVGPLGPARSSTDSGPSVNFMTLAALEHKAPAETDTSSTTSGTASLGALLSPSSRRSQSAGQPVPLSWAEADRQFYADRAAARAAARPGKRAVPLTWAEAERRRLAVDRQFYAGRAAAAGKGTAPLASMEADLEQPACSSTETVRGPVAPRSRPKSQKAAVSTAKQAEVPISWAMADRQFYASATTTNTVRLTAPSSSAAPTPSVARVSVAPFEQAVVAVQMAALSRHAESAGFDAESASFAASLTMTTPRTLQPEVNSGVRLIDMVSLTYLEDSEAEAAMLRNALTGSMA